ncbi:MAG TPA: Maf family protein [Solirubrobacteraceae bacterium]|nr:Maf family protein [Solirubrobacteraceae bacterium]
MIAPTRPVEQPRLILASGSPQRRAILTQLGVPFEVRVSGAAELTGEMPPRRLVVCNARRKAAAVMASEPAAARLPVLGVDTEVVLDGAVLGKPESAARALATLRELSNREHTVISGLAFRRGEDETVAVAETIVRFRALTDAEIAAYVDTGEWRDRAGGYAIQGRGALLVSEIRGDYLNVVGLPVAELVRVAPELF